MDPTAPPPTGGFDDEVCFHFYSFFYHMIHIKSYNKIPVVVQHIFQVLLFLLQIKIKLMHTHNKIPNLVRFLGPWGEFRNVPQKKLMSHSNNYFGALAWVPRASCLRCRQFNLKRSVERNSHSLIVSSTFDKILCTAVPYAGRTPCISCSRNR